MALFIPRPGFRVVSTPTGGRVIHVRTGDSLELSEVEVQLLARASAEGLDGADPKLKPVIKKLASLGLLVSANAAGTGVSTGAPVSTSTSPRAPAPPPAPPLPPPLPTARPVPALASLLDSGSPQDTEALLDQLGPMIEAPAVPPQPAVPPLPSNAPVPLVRADLQLQRRAGTDLYDVTDPVSGRTFPLYDFEVSLARMMDGRRHPADVIEAGKKLGIPITDESLGQFLAQLRGYGFIHTPELPAGAGPAEGGLWPVRAPWDAGIRELYQSGVRLLRQGKDQDARQYFETILEAQPDVVEARERLAELEVRAKEVSQLFADQPPVFMQTPSAPPPVPDDSHGPATAVPPPPPPRDPSPPEASFPPAPTKSRRVGSAARQGVLVLLAFAGGYFVRSALQPPETPPPPRGVARAPEVTPPPAPPPPQIRSEPSPAPAPAAAPPQPLAEAPTPPPTPAPATSEAESGSTPTRNAKAETVPDDGWSTFPVVRRGRVVKGELKAPGRGAVSWTVSAEQAVLKADTVGSFERAGQSVPLRAPAPGLLLPHVEDKAEVSTGTLLAKLVYREGFLQAVVSGPTPSTDWRCQVLDENTGRRAPCRVTTVTRRGSSALISATTEPLWFDECESPKVQLAPKDE